MNVFNFAFEIYEKIELNYYMIAKKMCNKEKKDNYEKLAFF